MCGGGGAVAAVGGRNSSGCAQGSGWRGQIICRPCIGREARGDVFTSRGVLQRTYQRMYIYMWSGERAIPIRCSGDQKRPRV